MKRMIALLLCLGALTGLCGCVEAPVSVPDAEENTAVPAEDISAAPRADPSEDGISELLPDVPGQGCAALLSVRSDGTADYIFYARTRGELERNGIDTLAGAGCQYYIISPDGSALAQPMDWAGQLDAALSAAGAADGAGHWTLSFSACEGNILFLAELRDRAGDAVLYTALYCLYDNELTQIPLRWTAESGAVRQIPRGHFYAAPDGLLIWDARAEDGVSFHRFAFDGSALPRFAGDDASVESFFGTGDSTAWLLRDHQIAALNQADGTISAEHTWSGGATMRGWAVTPDGAALYLLFNDYGRTAFRLERFDRDGSSRTVAVPGLIDTAPACMAAANDGTLYFVTEDGHRAVLRQYRPE